jgi:protein-S-isoprenylcysteine O-methyltransferase Ste14
MTLTTEQKSKAYGVAQTLLLCIFAAAHFFGPGHPFLPTGRITWTVSNLLCAAGVVLLLVAISRIGQSIQIAPEPKKTATLVTTGVYRYFRHPIYTAIMAVVLGLFLRKPTVLGAITGALVIVFLIIKVQFEEQLLRSRYPQYAEYMTKSWGLVPWPRRAQQ